MTSPDRAAPTLGELSGRPSDAVALSDSRRTVSWAQLEDRTNRIANGLLAGGLSPGDHVAIMATNRVEHLETVLGAWRAGLVYTPVKTGWTADEVGYLLDDAGTRAVVTDRETGRAAGRRRSLPVVDLDESFDGWVAAQSPDPLPADRCGWKLTYTSGTTGRPKGVVLPGSGATPFPVAYEGLARFAELARLPGEGVHLFVSRLFHGAPLTFGLGALARGAQLRVVERWDAAAVLTDLGDPAVTSTMMVPTMFRQMLAVPGIDRSHTCAPGLRTIFHGGEPCPQPLKRAMLDWLGPVLVEYYGFSEGGMTIATSEEWLARPGTVGRPGPGYSTRIVDDEGHELPPRQEGTICIVPASGRRFSYYQDPDKTASAHIGDAISVGDVGWLDEDGFLFISGRRADVVVSAGVNIYPAEIEEALSEVPGVLDMCAVGGPDPERGEVVVLHVSLVPGADQDEVLGALHAAGQERLAAYKRPARTLVVDEIPRDGTGKLLRPPLRAALWDGASAFAAAPPD